VATSSIAAKICIGNLLSLVTTRQACHLRARETEKRSLNRVQTLGIVPALLSGIDSKVREGEVARCIIDYVTMFDVPYGLGGAHGQVDVGTRHIIIEAEDSSKDQMFMRSDMSEGREQLGA